MRSAFHVSAAASCCRRCRRCRRGAPCSCLAQRWKQPLFAAAAAAASRQRRQHATLHAWEGADRLHSPPIARGFPLTVSHSPAAGSLMLRHRRPPIQTICRRWRPTPIPSRRVAAAAPSWPRCDSSPGCTHAHNTRSPCISYIAASAGERLRARQQAPWPGGHAIGRPGCCARTLPAGRASVHENTAGTLYQYSTVALCAIVTPSPGGRPPYSGWVLPACMAISHRCCSSSEAGGSGSGPRCRDE
jgi:hypothetical protein